MLFAAVATPRIEVPCTATVNSSLWMNSSLCPAPFSQQVKAMSLLRSRLWLYLAALWLYFSFTCDHGLRTGAGQQRVSPLSKRGAAGDIMLQLFMLRCLPFLQLTYWNLTSPFPPHRMKRMGFESSALHMPACQSPGKQSTDLTESYCTVAS